MKLNQKIASALRQKKATTMVDVLVAVMIVTMVMALFAQSVSAAVSIYQMSASVIEDTGKFNAVYYQTGSTREKMPDVAFHLTAPDGTVIELPLGGVQKFTDSSPDGTGITRYSIWIHDPASDPATPAGS